MKKMKSSKAKPPLKSNPQSNPTKTPTPHYLPPLTRLLSSSGSYPLPCPSFSIFYAAAAYLSVISQAGHLSPCFKAVLGFSTSDLGGGQVLPLRTASTQGARGTKTKWVHSRWYFFSQPVHMFEVDVLIWIRCVGLKCCDVGERVL